MRKILSMLIAFLVLIVGAQSILAIDNAYKNSLLKIEVSELDSNNYNIGLYTQKIYNEPVQIIKKSDTIYYFLLPETNHAITSVSPVGAIKNVLVKTYPYAGQDMNNGYTKVAIITAKPVNLSTSLKTLDTSVSPRLDPLRLARLDSVFERYSERLAQNNIPTPLAEFRKTASSKTPTIKSNVDVKTAPVKVAVATPKKAQQTTTATPKKTQAAPAKSFEDYQNQKNKSQAEQIAASTKKQAVQKTTVVSKPAAASKPVTTSKPAATKIAAVTKPAVVSVKSAAPVKQASSAKPAAETKQVATFVAPKTASKPSETSKAESAVKRETQKPAQKETTTSAVPKTAETPKSEKQPENNVKVATESKQTQNQNAEKQPSSEPIVVDSTVNMSFKQDETSANEENKQIEAKVADDKQDESASASNDENTNTNTNKNNDIWCWLAMLVGIASLYYLVGDVRKKKAAKKLALNALNQSNAPDIKEMLKKQTSHEDAQEQNEAGSSPETSNETVAQESDSVAEQHNEDEVQVTEEEQEKIDAFNTYMESVSQEEEQEPALIAQSTPDDEVIEQLYTPIESPVYKEEEAPMTYESYQNSLPAEEEDVATIVSSSKLTETRGLYLAKFDGATSLVGYIQDDIYVLYNFGNIEISDTEIESTLAQENDTDSLYLVKTGGKKLMVKSTPYDMSLEMVM